MDSFEEQYAKASAAWARIQRESPEGDTQDDFERERSIAAVLFEVHVRSCPLCAGQDPWKPEGMCAERDELAVKCLDRMNRHIPFWKRAAFGAVWWGGIALVALAIVAVLAVVLFIAGKLR